MAQQQEDREQSEETRRFAAEVGEAERGRLRGHAAKLRYVYGTVLASYGSHCVRRCFFSNHFAVVVADWVCGLVIGCCGMLQQTLRK
eukprot:COSAG02_NODE_4442_length_5352_cov_91.216638_2_plen_87_part_00